MQPLIPGLLGGPSQQSQTPQDMTLQARKQGLTAMMPQVQQHPRGFGTPQGKQQLAQLYGLMAANAKDPTTVGTSYVSALQQQQQLDAANSKEGRYTRIFGTVNPRDWTAESMKNFNDNYVKTGNLDHSLLVRYDGMSGTEEKIMNGYINDATAAQTRLYQTGDMINRLEDYAKTNPMRVGLAGKVNDFFRGVMGNEDAVKLLRVQYTKMKNAGVIDSLPQGVASDRDIEIARQGWPGTYANPAYIAAFLRGVQKMNIAQHEMNTHHAAFLGLYKTQTGMLDDWNTNGVAKLQRRWADAGMQFSPRQKGQSLVQAADAYYADQQPNMNGAPAGTQPGGFPTRQPVAKPDYMSILEDPKPKSKPTVWDSGTGGGIGDSGSSLTNMINRYRTIK